jgi:hypothetical protein
MPEISRVEAGRRRALAAKRAVAVIAVGGFVAVLGLARHAHPGTAAFSPSVGTASTGHSSHVQRKLSLAGGSIESSSTGSSSSGSFSQPQVQVQTSTS